jgi:regulator of sirC expression with transglutaminase-like and TPR domain
VSLRIEELWGPRAEVDLADLTAARESDDLAGALLAIEGAPRAAVAEARQTLDDLTLEARLHLADAHGPAERALALGQALRAFQGEHDDPHAPRNSHLARVLVRHRGLPILLSSIWMLVGRGAGLSVEGIGLPARFMVRVGGPDGVIVDPFEQGKLRTVDECRQLVTRLAGVAWNDSFLRAVRPDELLARVLRNLVGSHQHDDVALYRVARLWSSVAPGNIEPRLLAAEVAERLGAIPMALAALRETLDCLPPDPIARRIQTAIARLERLGGAN